MKCLKPFDIFISHVAEDKTDIVNDLAKSLRDVGFRVWYSADEISPGGSITGIVEKGLKQARYGVAVLSQQYVKSPWAIYELYTLMAQHNRKKVVIIPVWHNISSEEVKQLFPDVIDIFGLSTQKGLDYVVNKLKGEIRRGERICEFVSLLAWFNYKYKRQIRQFLIISFVVVGLVSIFYYINSFYPDKALANRIIKNNISKRNSEWRNINSICLLDIDSLVRLRALFDGKNARSNRHAFKFSDGDHVQVSSKVGLKRMDIPVDKANIQDKYGLINYSACLLRNEWTQDAYVLSYSFVNQDSVCYEIQDASLKNQNEYHVLVTYTNFIRVVNITCDYSLKDSSKMERISYLGINPSEELVFEKVGSKWQYVGSR